MAIALVTSGSASGNLTATTGSLDTTGSTLLVICATYATAVSVSDSKGNTWTGLTAQSNTGVYNQIFYVNSATPTVGTGHTFTISGASVYTVNVLTFSGTGASPFDVENGASTASAATLQPGSVTPTNDNNVLITGLTAGNAYAGAGSINLSFTITNQNALIGGVTYGGGAAYLLQGAKAATNPTWTFGSTCTNDSSTIAVFKAAVASGPTNLKSLDTNVKSNIKSYNTNPIANVKSINTNA